jgi:hypothetical protein
MPDEAQGILLVSETGGGGKLGSDSQDLVAGCRRPAAFRAGVCRRKEESGEASGGQSAISAGQVPLPT